MRIFILHFQSFLNLKIQLLQYLHARIKNVPVLFRLLGASITNVLCTGT
jgi:hypothetical protein